MLEQIVNAPLFDYMERGLAAANLRHEVIANNIANVNTPNFKKSNVIFEELLAKELATPPAGTLTVVRTHDRHMPVAPLEKAKATIEEDQSTTMRTDHNNVDIDIEMASMAKNQLYYNALSTLLGGHISAIKNVITTSGQA